MFHTSDSVYRTYDICNFWFWYSGHNSYSCWIISPFLLMCSVVIFLSDMAGGSPLYKKYAENFIVHFLPTYFSSLPPSRKKNERGVSDNQIVTCFSLSLSPHPYFLVRAFVFFSSPVPRELVIQIKRDTSVLSRIGALREVTQF